MNGADRSAGVGLLRRLREARGWSWSDMARALRDVARDLGVTSLADVQVASIQRTVARWESPNGHLGPSERNQFLLAHLYAWTAVGGFSTGEGSDFETLLLALHHFGASSERLQDLRELVAEYTRRDGGDLLALLHPETQPGLVQALRNPAQLEHDVVAGLVRLVSDVNRQVGTVPFVRLQLRLVPVIESCRRLTTVDTPAAVRDDLFALAAKAFALTGRFAFETRDDIAAAKLYQAATDAAGKLMDSRHRAAVRASHTMVTLYTTGDPTAASDIARAAVDDAERGSSITIRARALAVQAELSARSGSRCAAEAALLRAWKIIERDTTGDPNGEFSADRLNGFEGVCQLHAGRAESAQLHIDRCIRSLRTPRDVVQRGINTTDLAMTLQRLGDPRAAAELLHTSVDIAGSTGGRVPAQRIRQARLELRPWRTESFVADLDDHIHTALLGR